MDEMFEKLRALGCDFTRSENTLCPACSHLRKPHNRRRKCLLVRVRKNSVSLFCQNCGYTCKHYVDIPVVREYKVENNRTGVS
jgi:hypothetical protein